MLMAIIIQVQDLKKGGVTALLVGEGNVRGFSMHLYSGLPYA